MGSPTTEAGPASRCSPIAETATLQHPIAKMRVEGVLAFAFSARFRLVIV